MFISISQGLGEPTSLGNGRNGNVNKMPLGTRLLVNPIVPPRSVCHLCYETSVESNGSV
jgi:hypothetical protein